MIKISNCPITGLDRYVTRKELLTQEDLGDLQLQNVVRLTCTISHFKEGVLIENARIKTYKVDLVADNTIPVNKNTGAELDATIEGIWQDTNTISEYQFMINLKHVPIKQADLEFQYIMLRDAQGKFNS
jgi:hypothetical protein